MTFAQRMNRLIDDGTIVRVLRRDSSDVENIAGLQGGLTDLGFQLVGRGGRADPPGVYGAATTQAVKRFAERNAMAGDGSKITAALGRRLAHRHGFLDDLRHLRDAIDKPSVLRKLCRGSADKVSIAVLQEILNELGYGEQLGWARYGADGLYGRSTTAALKAFTGDCGIVSDGKSVTRDVAAAALDKLVHYYGDTWHRETPMVSVERLTIKKSNKRVTVSDGEHSKTFGLYKRGVYTVGSQKPAPFIDGNSDMLGALGLTPSSINVMLSVSENEGNLDAINTWDSAFFTFGMFQWTVGQRSAAGELPALLKKLKDRDPDVFERYYAQHGLDITHDTGDTTGRFTLNGRTIRSPQDKELLRTEKWAFRFWKSGQDPAVQAVEVEHALARLGTFYRSSRHQVAGHDIADIITSEYGVALILDNHVNRPAYVRPCLEGAVQRAGGAGNPTDWNTADERRVIEAYLEIREGYGRTPMTDAQKRGRNTRRCLERGQISDRRGSFRLA